MANDIKVTAAVAADGAIRTLDELTKGFKKTDDAAESVGESFGRLADEATAELERVRAASDKIASSLGDEFVAGLKGGSDAVDKLVVDLRQMGYEFDEIEADADKVADALRKMDGIRLRATEEDLGRASRKVNDLSDSARGANSALANMVGNSAQDLGELGGISGSVGVAIGQMAEYASDARLAGEGLGSSLKSMAMVAGPIAAISLATLAIGKYLERGKEQAEKLKAQAKQVADEIVRAAEAGDDLSEALARANAERLVNLFSDLAADGNKLTDLTADLAEFGLTYDDLINDYANGTTVVRDAINAYDATAEMSDKVTEAEARRYEAHKDVTRELGHLIDFSGGLVDENQLLFDITSRVYEALGLEKDAVDETSDALDRGTEAVKRYSDADIAARDGARKALDEWNAAAHAAFDQQQAELEAGVAAAQAFRDGINEAFRSAGEATLQLPEAASTSVDAFVSAFETAKSANDTFFGHVQAIAAQTSPEFAKYLLGMGSGATEMVAKMRMEEGGVQRAFQAYQGYAETMSSDFAAEMESAGGAGSKVFQAAMSNEVKTATGLAGQQGRQIGEAMTRGIKTGIEDTVGEAANAAAIAARQIANAARGALGLPDGAE